MSLINDALKRASQSDKDQPGQRIGSGPAMEPVHTPQGSKLTIILIAVVVIALSLAGWFFKQWWTTRNAMNAAAPPPAVVAQPAPAPVPTPVPAPPAPPLMTAPPVAAPVVVETPPPPVAVAPKVEPAPAAPVPPPVPTQPFPDLKVKGIFYRKTNPMALINGQTVGEGDSIQGVKITKIEPQKIIVEFNGETRELTME